MNEKNTEAKLYKKKIRGNLLINAIVYIVYLIAAIILFVCMWSKTALNVGLNEILITLAGPMDGAGGNTVNEALIYCIPRIAVFMGVVTAFYVYVYIRAVKLTKRAFNGDDSGEKPEEENSTPVIPKWLIVIRRTIAAASPVMVIVVLLYVNNSYSIVEYVSAKNTVSTIYEQHYVDPDNVEIKKEGKKKNLIQIYVESMESSYASAEDGGMQEENLIPGLTKLAKDNVSFTQTDGNSLGGFYSNYGATWTFGALYTSLSGVPYNLPVEGNAVPITDEYATGLTALGDILQDEGYHNEFLCGSDTEFAGRKQFLKSHGDYEIYDYYTAIEKKAIMPSYYAWWGFEDQKLYSIAKNELKRLADNEEPFNFTMLTADTHFPDGYRCELCENKYDEFAANIVDCTDRQLTQFISWIKEQPFYEDSVIVIMGDHPRMDTVLVEGVEWNNRRIYNCIINGEVPEHSRMVNREAMTFDMFPTILAALGYEIEGDKLGLGTNLYSDKKTLAEQISINDVEQQLAMKSDFYLNEFAPELVDEDLSEMTKKVKHVKDKKALKKIKRAKRKQEKERLEEEQRQMQEQEQDEQNNM